MISVKKYIGKRCEVTWKNDFVLRGIITDADNDTIEFKTNQKTSWVALDDIKMIIPLEDD